jgi:hypothetical protein
MVVFSPCPRADSSGIPCKQFLRFSVVVLMDALLHLRGGQLAVRFDDGALAVQPLRFDGVNR